MFRQIKSAIIWSYIYRFRSLLAKILVAIILIAVLEFVYKDIVEYLHLTNNVEYLWIALIFKWISILAILVFIGFSVLSLKTNKVCKKKHTKTVEPKKKMSKKEIRDLAQKIIRSKQENRLP